MKNDKIAAFVRKYEGKELEDAGGIMSTEWLCMFRALKNAVKAACESIGANLIQFKPLHYDGTGFVERDGKYAYIAFGQDALRGKVSLTITRVAGPILARSAKSDKDYKGGQNHFATIYGLSTALDEILSLSD